MDPTYKYEEASNLEELLGILRTSTIVRLDIVAVNGIGGAISNGMHELLLQFVRLPSLRQLKVFLAFFRTTSVVPVLQTRPLWDLDVTQAGLLEAIREQDGSSNFSRNIRPSLDTLRIQTSTKAWRNLLEYVDLSRIKRLALWYEQEKGEKGWGRVITASAPTLESLSLWLTPNILDRDIPTYLHFVSGFPVLHTIALFFTIEDQRTTTLWMSTFPPTLAAIHSCAPSLHCIRVYIHAWNGEYSYKALLQNPHFAEFARKVKALKNLETIELSFRHPLGPPSNDNKIEQDQLAELFSPVYLSVEYGVFWNHAWPFFRDDRVGARWARIMNS
ncbi:hypothetical protein DL96DRAFT_1638853 [Flagelloscypha sp. PMI_526]|nr:hypothetical protein DL96DRAFT_1638853 [Flagelloscypha sp. PMI_526]